MWDPIIDAPDWTLGIRSDVLNAYAPQARALFPDSFEIFNNPNTPWPGVTAEYHEPFYVTQEIWTGVDGRDPWVGRWLRSVGNPPSWNDFDDPAPPDKPTFAQLMIGVRWWFSSPRRQAYGDWGATFTGDIGGQLLSSLHVLMRRELSEPVSHDSGDIEIGRGFEHLPAAVHAASRASDAGEVLVPHIFRKRENKATVTFWTQREQNSFLDAARRKANEVESAYNEVLVEFQTLYDAWVASGIDITASTTIADLATMEAAYNAMADYADPEAVKKRLAEHQAKITPDALPSDLPTLREVLIERLEGVSAQHIRDLKGARSQQGFDLPAACDDMANAERKIGAEHTSAVLKLARADTIDEVKRTFALAKAKIEAIRALNVPTFHVLGHATALPTEQAKFKQRSITVTVRQKDLPIGELTVDVGLTSFNMSARKVRQTEDVIAYELTLTGDEPVTAVFISRNICGYSRLQLTLEPPEEDE